ncbi:MAG: autotransporter-associated beta strand repeat-containing protein, partial [Phreatobacter sp.]
GGGGGFGGAIFVRDGASLNISGSGTFSGGSSMGGAGRSGGGDGAAAGSDLFLPTGTTTFNPTGTLTFNGSIGDASASSVPAGQSYAPGSGPGAAIAIIGGTVVLNGRNTYAGGTTVSDATVVAGNASAFGNGTLTLSRGTLQAGAAGLTIGNGVMLATGGGTVDTNGQTLTLTGVITGADLTKTGAGTLVLSGANTYSGTTSLTQGTLRLANSQALGTSTLVTTGSVVDYAAGVDIANTIVIQSNTTQFQVLSGTATQTGEVQQTGGARPLEKIGDGTLIVRQLSNSGTTTVSAGTLQAGAANAFSAQSAHVIASGATLDLGGFGQTIASLAGAGIVTNGGSSAALLDIAGTTNISTTFSGVIKDGAGSLALQFNMPGTLTLTGANSYAGGTTVVGGTVVAGNASAFGSGILALSGATLRAGAAGLTIGNGITLAKTGGTVDTNGQTLTLSGVITGADLTKTGTGTLVLSGANTYSGTTALTQGTLRLANNRALGTSTLVTTGSVVDYAAGVDIANTI